MAIPESQLQTWSHQGAVTTAKATHESIRRALEKYDDWLDDIKYKVYLQGSYRNDTNIRGDSDVDVVAELKSTFRRDLANLSVDEKRRYHECYSSATYAWPEFRADVLKALRDYYGSNVVREGKKCLKVAPGSGRLAADVVVCMQYRKYRRFSSLSVQSYIEGMTFYVPSEARWVVNYPKLHYENGVKKNSSSATKGWYKPVVRVFKNARTYLVDHYLMAADIAPSYFLECFLYNVPNSSFGSNFGDTYLSVLKSLLEADKSSFVCQNGQLALFGATPEQWSEENARELITQLIELWKDWGA